MSENENSDGINLRLHTFATALRWNECHFLVHETLQQIIAFDISLCVRLLVRFVNGTHKMRLKSMGHLSEFVDLFTFHSFPLLRVQLSNEMLRRVEIYDVFHHVELIGIAQSHPILLIS